MHDIADVQTNAIVVSNDSTERTIYSVTVPANSINSATLYQLLMAGTMSSLGSSPGNMTMRVHMGSTTETVFSEALNAGISSSGWISNINCWMLPSGVSALGGFFLQNSAEIFSTAGGRIHPAAVGAQDFTIDNTVSVTIQFDTADPANVFTRGVAALMVP